jgi:hypothetical protein
MLDIDAPRTGAAQIADQLFEGWWCAKGIFGKNVQE